MTSEFTEEEQGQATRAVAILLADGFGEARAMELVYGATMAWRKKEISRDPVAFAKHLLELRRALS
jgi:hypothetical protein